jgi:hypothetical protein
MNLVRTVFLVSAVAVAVAVVPVAMAGNPTPAELKALEIRGQALDQQCDNPTLSREAFRALCGNAGAQNQPTRSELKALEIRGQAMNKIAAGQVTQVVRSSGFDWSDFGIGAGAMLGFVLLAGGIAAGAYYSRKNRVGPRTAS